MKKIFIIIFSLATASVFSQQGWFFLNPTPTGNPLFDIRMFNQNTGIIAGYKEILKTTNGGENWSVASMLNSHAIDLDMVNDSTGYMAIDSGNVLKTTNGGLNWYSYSKINSVSIYKIQFQNYSTGYVLANLDSGFQWLQKIFRTTNGGLSWDEQLSTNDYTLRNIFFTSSTGYAVGQNKESINNTQKSKILKTTNSGVTWDSIPNDFYFDFTTMCFINDSTGYISGQGVYFTYKTTNGGLTWSQRGEFGAGVTDLKFLNSNFGFALCGNRLFKTQDAGLHWQSFNIITPGNPSIYTISIINENKYIGIGYKGLILSTTNGGINWINYTKNTINADLYDIKFADMNTGFVSGYKNGMLFRSTNGGLNWSSLAPVSGNQVGFSQCVPINANVWYVPEFYSGKVYKTSNCGANWSVSPAIRYGITRLKFLNENTGFGVCKYTYFIKTTNGGTTWDVNNSLNIGQNWSVDFIDAYTGMAGGNKLLKTTNSGEYWDTVKAISGFSNDIKYLNHDTIFVVTFTGVNRTTNGGANWYETILPGIYNPFVQFPNNRIGYILSSDRMFKTTNTGVTWFEINFPGYSYLNGLSFIDSLTGFAAGHYSQILKTTDGGTPSVLLPFPEYIPQTFSLHQNYPNPFNPTTKIKFDLPKDGNVKIIIFDIIGREIEKLADEKFSAGVHELQWNAARYSAGVYFYMLLTDNIKETKKMVLIK